MKACVLILNGDESLFLSSSINLKSLAVCHPFMYLHLFLYLLNGCKDWWIVQEHSYLHLIHPCKWMSKLMEFVYQQC